MIYPAPTDLGQWHPEHKRASQQPGASIIKTLDPRTHCRAWPQVAQSVTQPGLGQRVNAAPPAPLVPAGQHELHIVAYAE